MGRLLMVSFMFLCLQKGLISEDLCGETSHVSGEVGGEVVLHVQETEVQDITWMTKRYLFAVTKPGRLVTIRNIIYSGRLNATDDGSLIISKITREDRGLYKGSVLRGTSGQCVQFYELELKGLPLEDLCGETRHVSGEVGGEVVLHVPETAVLDLTWMTDRIRNIFAVTEPGRSVTIRSRIYDGRLNAKDDGSLIITQLTREDQGIYKGSVLRRRSSQCVQFYNLTVHEEEVSIRNSSPTPPTTINSGAEISRDGATTSKKQASAWIVIILCVLATVALMLMFIVSILLSRSPVGGSHTAEKLEYCDLNMKRLQKATVASTNKDETIYSYLAFSKTVKKTKG